MVAVPSLWLKLWPYSLAEEPQREGSQLPKTTCSQLLPSQGSASSWCSSFASITTPYHSPLFWSLGFCFCRGSMRVLPIACSSSFLTEGSSLPLPAAPTPDPAGHLTEHPSSSWGHPCLCWPSEDHQEPAVAWDLPGSAQPQELRVEKGGCTLGDGCTTWVRQDPWGSFSPPDRPLRTSLRCGNQLCRELLLCALSAS